MTQTHKPDQFFSRHENTRRLRMNIKLTLSLKREEPMTSDERQIFKKLGDKRYNFLKLIGYRQVFPPVKLQLTNKVSSSK